MAFAAHHADLHTTRPDGSCLKDHLALIVARGPATRGYAEANGKLHGPPEPQALAYLWHWYLEIRAGQQSSGMGGDKVSWGDITHWRELTGHDPQPFDVRSVLLIDATVRKAMHDAQPKIKPQHQQSAPHARH